MLVRDALARRVDLGAQSDNLIYVKTTVTDFQRHFRQAREAADRGDTVIVTGEHGDYVFERLAATADHPFAGLDGVFGAVTLPREHTRLREKVRRRLAVQDRRRRRRTA
jgi:dihydrodipicolinate synthase/N-acetylneuraminate lyase